MVRLRLALFAVVPLLMACVDRGATSQPTQKPVHTHRLFIDGGRGVPSTLDALWQQSATVFEGRVEGAEAVPDVHKPTEPPPVPTTRISIRVLRTFKGDSGITPDHTVPVIMIGAVRDRGEYLESYEDEDFPLLKTGEQAILFLTWDEAQQAYQTATDSADSVYVIHRRSVASHGRSSLARRLSTLSCSELETLLAAQGGVR